MGTPRVKSCSFFTSEFSKDRFLFEIDDPTKLATPECRKLQIPYIIYRSAWALWWLALLFYDLSTDKKVQTFPIFLTNWSYIILGVSAFLQLASAIYFAVKERKGEEIEMSLLLKVNWAFYSMASPAAILVSIVYWSALYDPADGIRFLDTATHLINSLYVIIDVFITAIPFRLLHIWIPTLYGLIYLVFTLIYFGASGGEIIYSILDYENGTGLAVGLIFIILLVALPFCHVLVFLLYWVRLLVYGACCKGNAVEGSGDEKSGEMEGHDNPSLVV